MSDLKFNIKASDIASVKEQTEKVIEKIKQDLNKSVKALGRGAEQEAKKISSEKLSGSLDQIYKDNLYTEELSDNMVIVGIREQALWIEEGRKGGFMDELLTQKSGSPVKTSKEGNKYRVIPMEQNVAGGGGSTESGQQFVSELKTFLRRQGIRYSKTRGLALDENGSPRIGKVDTINIKNMRDGAKKAANKLSRNIDGISVFQNKNPKTGRVERNIMAFRVISEKSKDKWIHPGRPPEKILDEVYKWVEKTWEQQLLPELKKKYESK